MQIPINMFILSTDKIHLYGSTYSKITTVQYLYLMIIVGQLISCNATVLARSTRVFIIDDPNTL